MEQVQEVGLWWKERESVFVRGKSCVWGAWDETEEVNMRRKNKQEEFCVKLVWSCRDNREECVRQFFGVNEEGRGKRVREDIVLKNTKIRSARMNSKSKS